MCHLPLLTRSHDSFFHVMCSATMPVEDLELLVDRMIAADIK
jgi:hypothetical protein